MPATHDNQLGNYLKTRRAKLDPAALGFPLNRRRTPGLRREEVAQRANVSATWYTWLEQGRGGLPSTEVLDRLARALMLTSFEREHLYLIARGHTPEVHYQGRENISPRIQRVLDALEFSPAFIRTATWDAVAWNRAAAALFGFEQLLPEQRNLLRRMFIDPRARAMQRDWTSVARFAVAAFRADAARAGAGANVKALVDELSRLSPEFAQFWRENDVLAHGENAKHIRHPIAGPLTMEYSAFPVDGRTDLNLVIFNPATAKDIDRIRRLVQNQSPKKSPRKTRR